MDGTLKLFDFGLAKRMDPTDKSDDGLYCLTGNTGSLRYMAPEVAKVSVMSGEVCFYNVFEGFDSDTCITIRKK